MACRTRCAWLQWMAALDGRRGRRGRCGWKDARCAGSRRPKDRRRCPPALEALYGVRLVQWAPFLARRAMEGLAGTLQVPQKALDDSRRPSMVLMCMCGVAPLSGTRSAQCPMELVQGVPLLRAAQIPGMQARVCPTRGGPDEVAQGWSSPSGWGRFRPQIDRTRREFDEGRRAISAQNRPSWVRCERSLARIPLEFSLTQPNLASSRPTLVRFGQMRQEFGQA